MNKASLLDKFTAIAHMVPTPFYCLDLNQHYIGINKSGLAELGLLDKAEDLSTKTPYDFYPKAIASLLVGYHQEAIRTGKTLATREPVNHSDNQPYSLTIKPLYDANNQVIGTSAVSVRLTSNKLPTQTIKNPSNKTTTDRLRKLADTIPVPFYWLDLNQYYLGINQAALEITNALSYESNFHGKTPYDIYPYELAHNIVAHHKEVIKTNKIFFTEESIRDFTGKTKYFRATIAPLHDSKGNIIGTYGVSINITAEKQAGVIGVEGSGLKKQSKYTAKDNALKQMKKLADAIPLAFYWLDLNQYYLGVNEFGFKATGTTSYKKDFRTRTPYDVYAYDMAHNIVLNHRQVINTNRVNFKEEPINDLTTGEVKHFKAIIAPLNDDHGNTIGTYGFSIDVTAEKQAKLRKQAQQEKFNRIISQAVHDIRSPLAGMLMIVKVSVMLPVPIRLALKDAAGSINDIAENLLQNWREMGDKEAMIEEQQARPVVLSLLAMQVIAGKRFQFQDSPIKFKLEIDEKCYFSCIQANASRFKRNLSNLINNAVAAYKDGVGEVTCQLEAHQGQVIVKVKDQGKGIAPEVLDKINQGIQVTSGKQDGQGIGLTQVRDTLELFKGTLAIDSAPGQGTEMRLSFPVTSLAPWLADSISLTTDDTLVILDDDDSMHQAWQALLKQRGYYQLICQKIHHFTQGQEAINYLNGLADKARVVLLTDYELLNQPVDGIDVIKQTGIKRTVMVTSHYDDKSLRKYIDSAGVKILPKQLAWQVPIILDNAVTN